MLSPMEYLGNMGRLLLCKGHGVVVPWRLTLAGSGKLFSMEVAVEHQEACHIPTMGEILKYGE